MKTSLISLSYNKLEETTKPFLKSLYENTNPEDFELIFIDNASTDGTAEYLKEFAQKYNNIKLILNDENLGYSKANNQGLKIASGDYIGLLNNDIYLTEGWLEKTIKAIDSYENVGLLSPRINHPKDKGINTNNLKDEAIRIPLLFGNDYLKTFRPDFCCVFMKKEVFEKVGYLDEAFTPAWYEDDDYAIRVLYQGYQNVIYNRVFVFHNCSKTTGGFRKTPEGRKIFNRNREYFYKKHYLANRIWELEKKLNRFRSSIFFKLWSVKYLPRAFWGSFKNKQQQKRSLIYDTKQY